MRLQNRLVLFMAVLAGYSVLLHASVEPLLARNALVGKWKAEITSDDGSKILEDTLTFKGGVFTSDLEKTDGFDPAAYEDDPAPQGISAKFSVTLTNKTGDIAAWAGFSTGTDMTGTLVVTKKDGSSTSYSFKATKL